MTKTQKHVYSLLSCTLFFPCIFSSNPTGDVAKKSGHITHNKGVTMFFRTLILSIFSVFPLFSQAFTVIYDDPSPPTINCGDYSVASGKNCRDTTALAYRYGGKPYIQNGIHLSVGHFIALSNTNAVRLESLSPGEVVWVRQQEVVGLAVATRQCTDQEKTARSLKTGLAWALLIGVLTKNTDYALGAGVVSAAGSEFSDCRVVVPREVGRVAGMANEKASVINGRKVLPSSHICPTATDTPAKDGEQQGCFVSGGGKPVLNCGHAEWHIATLVSGNAVTQGCFRPNT